MPTLPWQNINAAANQAEHTAMLTYLPLKHYRDSPRFFVFIFQIFLQLRRTNGLIGFSMRANPVTKQYWTLSLWENGDAINQYIHTPPYFNVMKKMKSSMGQTAFSSWPITDSNTELDWDNALTHQTKKN